MRTLHLAVGSLGLAASVVSFPQTATAACTAGSVCYTGSNNNSGAVEGEDTGSGVGVSAFSNTGVAATAQTNSGAYAISGENNGTGGGIYASGGGNGVYAYGLGNGVYAHSPSTAGNGVYATSEENTAGYAAGYFYASSTGTYANGVAATVAGAGTGLYARTYGGYGVYAIDQGTSSSAYAIYGTSTDGTGLYAQSTNGIGVNGWSGNNTGVAGTSAAASSGIGVYGYCAGTNCDALWGGCTASGCYAGYFSGNVYATGSISHGSDARLKKNIEPLEHALDKLLQLKGVSYEWIDPVTHGNQTGKRKGFIAQDVERVFPDWVGTDDKGFKTLSVDQIEALEVESIRTLKMDNDVLRDHVAALESGRKPVVSGIDLNGIGFGVGGLAIAGALVLTRRKRDCT